jgi:hypothetical protein
MRDTPEHWERSTPYQDADLQLEKQASAFFGDGGNPSPLGEEKFVNSRHPTLEAWRPYKVGFGSPTDPDPYVRQAVAGRAGIC